MANEVNREQAIRNFPTEQVGQGYAKPLNISIDGAYNPATGAALVAVASGTVGFQVDTDGKRCIAWDDTATTTDPAGIQVTLPEDFYEEKNSTDKEGGLVVRLQLRKLDLTGAAADNADLTLLVVPKITAPDWDADGDEAGDGQASITGSTATVLAAQLAESPVATEEDARYIDIDVMALFTAAQRKTHFVPGAVLRLEMNPHEAVGTDLELRLSSILGRYKGHEQVTYAKWRRAVSA